MNVFGHSERSWRKAQKRGVSPIIATILLVAITVVLAAVLYVLISGLTHGPGSTPIGSAFSTGTPVASTCTAGFTLAANGCIGGHFIYTMAVGTSTVTFGSVLFQVKTPAGAVFANVGVASFAVMPIAGAPSATYMVAAAAGLSMTSGGWTVYAAGVSSSTPLTSLYTIIIDTGAASSISGLGYTFNALGTGSYGDSTSPVTLP